MSADSEKDYSDFDKILNHTTELDLSSTPLATQVASELNKKSRLEKVSHPTPENTRIIAITNQKGGVGKTTTTVNIAASLAQGGKNILVIDLDPQGNCSTALGVNHESSIPSIYECLINSTPVNDIIQPCPDIKNLDVAPATINLSGSELELVSMVSRENRLKKCIKNYTDFRSNQGLPRYDFILIDCPPSLGLLTINAFTAADEILIPIQAQYYALEGLSQLLNTINLVKSQLNETQKPPLMLITMYDSRTNLSNDVVNDVHEHFPKQILNTIIPQAVRLSEAPSHAQTIITYEPDSIGALAYKEAAYEISTWNYRED
ncbi:MAG: AAA family ATPase [Bifidobacteriaceae bacterium]|jgi:chromosome partitioning protein|nr:AAA family ATPase [Bifidobacteriaceae bacterium]